MGYRLPRTRVSARDVPDPRVIRDTVQPVVEELAGNLNEHNVKAGTFQPNHQTDACLYDFHYASVEADGHIDTNGNKQPDGLAANAYRVPEVGDWTVVTGATLTYVSGEHVAWVIAWCYYGLDNAGTTYTESAVTNKFARVQFAIRANGNVVDTTPSGTSEIGVGAPRSVRPINPVQGIGPHDMRTLDYQTTRGTSSLCWPVRPVRVQCKVPLPQGTTTVELVVRRVLPEDDTVNSSPPPVYVLNRKIVCVEMKLGGTGSNSGQAVSVAYPVEGDAVNASKLDTTLALPVNAAINDLAIDAVRRAGLRKEHLPGLSGGSGVATGQVYKLAGTQLTAGTNTARAYPGVGTDGTVGVGGWQVVSNGAGTNLEGPVNWNFATTPGFVLILANVGFSLAGGVLNVPERYGVFSIGTLYNSGASSMTQSAQGWINDPNIYTDNTPTVRSNDCFTDVPLMEYYDYRAAPPANGAVNLFRVLVSDYNTVNVEWENSSIFVLIFGK